MNAYITACRKCKRPLKRGERKKLAILREIGTGFSTDGWSHYLCPHCAGVVEEVLDKWLGGKR